MIWPLADAAETIGERNRVSLLNERHSRRVFLLLR